MPEDRLAIPAPLKRRVLVEAGHRCAIPTCRHIEIEIHHIVPYSQCQIHEYENLIALCPNCHRRADAGHIDRPALRLYKANLRFAHDKFSQFEMDLLFQLVQVPPGQALLFPSFLALLIKRLLDANYARIDVNTGGFASSMGMKLSPDHLTITKEGRQFVDSLNMDLDN